ncbi:microfibril-associated glycoprotein 4-like isoform X1 [Saccostrea cucullata]|uniref:microfibril-associated glycoprotein 4-like isoform X1 n=1 Tax=Saccostrea cuccullata TaxID=36930 RepID=UPI002ED66FF8
MAGVWSSSFVCSLFFCAASSQQIYFNDKNDCVRNDQTTQTFDEKVEYLKQENARQIELLRHEIAKQIDSLRRDNTRITANQMNIQEEFDELFSILMKNVTNIHEDLKSYILQTIESELHRYKDCKNLYINGNTESGVYAIYPFSIESKVSVFCDMMTESGGWTAIQKRVSGSVSFDRTWSDYKTGFGKANDSYWIGNDVIHQLTKGRNSSLYVSITLTNGTKLYELYNQFSVADEANKYRLFLGGPATGTLGDSMLHTGYPYYYDLSGMYFSTSDRDNDGWSFGNCAAVSTRRGGWWFNECHRAFLNGQWFPGSWIKPWYPTVTKSKKIKETLIMIKPT